MKKVKIYFFFTSLTQKMKFDVYFQKPPELCPALLSGAYTGIHPGVQHG